MAEDYVLTALGDEQRDAFRSLLRQVATQADALDPVLNACDVVEEFEAKPRRRNRTP